jgi:hypothetical protein
MCNGVGSPESDHNGVALPSFRGRLCDRAGEPAEMRKTKQHRYLFFTFDDPTKLYNGLSVHIISYTCESLGRIEEHLTVEFWANHNAPTRVSIW